MKQRTFWLSLLGTFILTALPAGLQAQQPGPLRVTASAMTREGFSLGWDAVSADSAYTVQARDALDEAVWINPRVGAPWPSGMRSWTDPRPVAAARRFYRVVAVSAAQRGKLLSSSKLGAYSLFQLSLLLQLQGVPVTPRYGVDVYKLVYETVDPLGERTVASGALVLPQNPDKPMPLASYQHGTLTQRSQAPSANTTGETLSGVIFAATGYVTAVPDYLGLGDSPGRHPYHHASSEATACVDMLRAGRAFCATKGLALNGQLFLCGYSQGGHATMALHRELEAYHAPEFTVTAAAPMAGAYDLSGVTSADFLSGRAMPNPYYFPYLLASYQAVYHFANSLADVLAAPYQATLPPLLDNQASGGQINSVMPPVPIRILRPEVLAAFKANPNHPLRQALRDNDLYEWTPRAPLRLYHCHGDQDVPVANTEVARASFLSRGATQVEWVDADPTAGHGDCALPSLLEAKVWFDGMKR